MCLYYRQLGTGLGTDLLDLIRRDLFVDELEDDLMGDSVDPTKFMIKSGMRLAFMKIERFVQVGREITEG